MNSRCLIILLLIKIISPSIKIEISKSLFDKSFEKLIPYLLSNILPLKIADNDFTISTYVNINVSLKNVQIDIGELTKDHFKLIFKESNKIIIKLFDLSANGTVDLAVNTVLYSETQKIKLEITNLSLEVEILLNSVSNGGRKIPTVYINRVHLHRFEYDFALKGTIIAALGNLFKDKLKQFVDDKVKEFFNQDFVGLTRPAVEKVVMEMPEAIPIFRDIKILFSFPSEIMIQRDKIVAEIDVDYLNNEDRDKSRKENNFDKVKVDL
jgi:hypothetical protein